MELNSLEERIAINVHNWKVSTQFRAYPFERALFSTPNRVLLVSTQFKAYPFERALFSALNRVSLIN